MTKIIKYNLLMKLALIIIGANFILLPTLVLAKNSAKKNSKKATTTESNVDTEAQAASGETKKHALGVGLGETFLLGDFREKGSDNITVDLLYSYSASHSFDLLLDFHYSKHSHKDERVYLSGLGLGIKGKLYQFDAFAPYFVGGFGFYRPTMRRRNGSTLQETHGRVTFGNHVGAGADLQLNKSVSVGLLVSYHNPFDVKQDDGPEVEGSYFKLLMTTMYTF